MNVILLLANMIILGGPGLRPKIGKQNAQNISDVYPEFTEQISKGNYYKGIKNTTRQI
jgi:hypothetical protein